MYVVITGCNQTITFVQSPFCEEACTRPQDRVIVVCEDGFTVNSESGELKTLKCIVVPGKQGEKSHTISVSQIVLVPKGAIVKVMNRGIGDFELYKITKMKSPLYKQTFMKYKIDVKRMLMKSFVNILTKGKGCKKIKRELLVSNATAKQFWQLMVLQTKRVFGSEAKTVLTQNDETWGVYKKRIDNCLFPKTTWKGFEKEAKDFWTHTYIHFNKSNVVQFECA